MDIPTPKELKKLADTCRKVGIKSFKCQSFEFTLTDEIPTLKSSKSKHQLLDNSHPQKQIESEGELSEDQLLFYSIPTHGEVNT